MKRTDFIKIIRIRSERRIDKRRGDYKLPDGTKLSQLVSHLVYTQLAIDNLGIQCNGDICERNRELEGLFPETGLPEIYTGITHIERVERLVKEIIGG